jgi:hypothetical protein
MKPIGPPAYAPVLTRGTVEFGLNARLIDVANPDLTSLEKTDEKTTSKTKTQPPVHPVRTPVGIKPPRVLRDLNVLNPVLANSMVEFLSRVLPSRKCLLPLTPEESYATLKRPSQRAKYNLALHDDPCETDMAVNCFTKAEALTKFGAPRNISPLPAATMSNMSRYTLPLSKYVKTHNKWYAFGRPPIEIAQQVADGLSQASLVFLGDFSKMDGHVSNIGRILTDAMYRRAYGSSDDLEAVLRGKRNRKLRIIFRADNTSLTVDTSGNSRLSGEPGTSLDNTMENAFIAFHAYYCLLGDYSKSWEAMKRCSFGGDDSLMPDMKKRNYTLTASVLGHTVTGEELKRGDGRVNFLARYFSPAVWRGDPNSCSDILRQVSKFHTTQHAPETPASKLIQKCQSFYLTDANTPIIGPLCRKVLSIANTTSPLLRRGVKPARWWDQYDHAEQFPNQNTEDFMMELLSIQMPSFNLEGFYERLNECKTLEDIMEGYGCDYSIATKPANIVCDQIHDDTIRGSGCKVLGDGKKVDAKVKLALKNRSADKSEDAKDSVPRRAESTKGKRPHKPRAPNGRSRAKPGKRGGSAYKHPAAVAMRQRQTKPVESGDSRLARAKPRHGRRTKRVTFAVPPAKA